MSLTNIKTEALLSEIIDRASDQLADPEPMYDGILSFLTESELDWLMGEASAAIDKAIERAKSRNLS